MVPAYTHEILFRNKNDFGEHLNSNRKSYRNLRKQDLR